MASDGNMEGWKTYTSSEYTFQYPPTYTVEAPTDGFRVLKLRGEGGSLEIWSMNDFQERPIDFGDANLTPEQREAALPKQEWDVRTKSAEPSRLYNYTARLFYTDEQTREIIQQVVNSIR